MAVAATQLNALADLTCWCFPVAIHVTKDSCTLLLTLLLQRAGWETCPRALLQKCEFVLDAGDQWCRGVRLAWACLQLTIGQLDVWLRRGLDSCIVLCTDFQV